MLSGRAVEQVIKPGTDVLDELIAGWQQAGVDEGLADLAAGVAAGERVDQLVGERAVVAGQFGEHAGAVAAVQPGQHALGVSRAAECLPDGAKAGADGMSGPAEQLVHAFFERAAGAYAAGQAVGWPAADVAQVVVVMAGAGPADRPPGSIQAGQDTGLPAGWARVRISADARVAADAGSAGLPPGGDGRELAAEAAPVRWRGVAAFADWLAVVASLQGSSLPALRALLDRPPVAGGA